jgi:hypothetical protein
MTVVTEAFPFWNTDFHILRLVGKEWAVVEQMYSAGPERKNGTGKQSQDGRVQE